MATRPGRGGPVLSFRDADVAVVEDSFSLRETDRSPSGYTVYKVEFKVSTTTPEGHPVLQDCATWKRFSDFQNLAKQLESIQCSVATDSKFPYLVKANYFDRFKESVIEERRVSAEALLQFASKPPHLSSSIPLTDFLTGAIVERIVPLNKPRLSDDVTTVISTNPDSSSNNNDDPSDSFTVVNTAVPNDDEVLQLTEEDVGAGFIRSNSVMVSEWGLEHTLTLRDEGKPDIAPLLEGEEEEQDESITKTTPPTHITIDKADSEGGSEGLREGEELPLPSTPVIVSKSSSKTDWWSAALAESGGVVDDYDSLIETLESKDNSSFVYKKNLNVHGTKSRSSSPSPQKDGSDRRRLSPSANGEYILQAGKLITLGLEYEKKGDIEEAFDLFKAGVDVLLSGVQADTSTSRREAVRKKTAEYLQYTEVLQKKLQLKKSKEDAKQNSNVKPHLINDFKIISIIAKTVLFVESVHTAQRFVFKVLHKSLTAQQRGRVQGRMMRSRNRSPTQCPYMVNLLHHYETQSNRIFLLLEHVSGGQLVEHLQSIRNHCAGKERRKKKAKNQEEYRTMPNRVVIGGEVSPVDKKNEDLTPPLTGNVVAHPPPEEDDIVLAKLRSLEPPPSHPVLSSLTSISSESDSGTNEEDSLTRLTRIVKEDAAMMRIQEEKENEGEEEIGRADEVVERDRLSDLRKQLMESFLEDDEDPNNGLHGDHLGNEIESVDNSELKGNHNELSDDGFTEDQRPQPDGEDFDDEKNGEFSELEKHLMAFVSKPIAIDNLEQSEGANPSMVPSNSIEKENIPSSSSPNSVMNVDLHKESTSNQLLVDITGHDDSEPSDVPSALNEIENQVNSGSVDLALKDPLSTSQDRSSTSQDPSSTSQDPSSTSIQVIPPTPTASSVPIPPTPEQSSVLKKPDHNHQTMPMEKGRKSSSPRKSPEFSPVVSLRSSPDTSRFSSASQEAEIEQNARKWTAQIIKALEHLHANGIVCKDLHPRNILMTSSGDIRLTYFGKWDYVTPNINNEAIKKLYVAPELLGVEEPGPISDWWSLGAVLFEILVGKSLVDCHPGGVHSHIPLTLPASVSPEAASLLQGFLQVNPRERLGSGMNGVEDIKSHPFFHSIVWNAL